VFGNVAAGDVPASSRGATVAVAGSDFQGVLASRHFTVVEDLGKAADWPVPFETGTALLVPLAASGKTLGALAVAYPRGSVVFAENPDVALVETFAGQAALALERVRSALLAVLREALSTVARHARASGVEVAVSARDGWLRLVVTDDGVGVGDAVGSGGLRNMRHRAEELGGEFRVDAATPLGTALTWQVRI
jgi:GAF domain-containing protein